MKGLIPRFIYNPPPQRKCEQYWSDNVNDTFDAGSLVVTLTDLVPYADYEIKRFSIKDVSVR